MVLKGLPLAALFAGAAGFGAFPECGGGADALGFGITPGSLATWGIPEGEETCENSILLTTIGAGVTQYAACTYYAEHFASILVSIGVTWNWDPDRPTVLYYCEEYCAGLGVPTPCTSQEFDDPGPSLFSRDLTPYGMSEIKGDGVTEQCETCTAGEPFPEGSTMCCDWGQYELGTDYTIEEHFAEGVYTFEDCAETCANTAGCTGMELYGTPNFCSLWFNEKCSSLDSPGAYANGQDCRTYLLDPSFRMAA